MSKENKPIITKDKFDVSESETRHSIPIFDEEGTIRYFIECSKEEYKVWCTTYRRDDLVLNNIHQRQLTIKNNFDKDE